LNLLLHAKNISRVQEEVQKLAKNFGQGPSFSIASGKYVTCEFSFESLQKSICMLVNQQPSHSKVQD